jgi:hypothetical protein
MIDALKIYMLARMARVLVFIGRAAEYVRAASCGKTGALSGEATAWYDARDAAWRLARARRGSHDEKQSEPLS